MSVAYVVVWAEGVTDTPRPTYDDALAAVWSVLGQVRIEPRDVAEHGQRAFFWASGEPITNAPAGYIERRDEYGLGEYAGMVWAAGQLASDVLNSLPAGDDASPEEQVDAQSDPAAVARRHDWPADKFRELVIEALARFQAEGVDRD